MFLLFISIIGIANVFAQQKPQYTQYIFNNYLLNPALSGIENYMDIKVGHREQWSGIENSPKTSFISAHWNLSDEYLWKNPLSLPETGNDPMSRSYLQHYTSSPAHHGMGIMAISDKTGPISRLDVGLTYAYHLQLSGLYNLSVGVYGGVSRIALDVNDLTLENANDPALSNVLAAQFKPDLGVGTWYYGPSFFAGLAIQQIIPQKLAFTNSTNYTEGKTVPHVFLTAGYKFFLDEEISVVPSAMVKKIPSLPVSFDTNIKFSYKDKIWLGGSYRKSDSFSAMLGFNFKNFVNLTYAYDITTSALKTVSSGSHEIVLGFQLNATYSVFSGGKKWH